MSFYMLSTSNVQKIRRQGQNLLQWLYYIMHLLRKKGRLDRKPFFDYY